MNQHRFIQIYIFLQNRTYMATTPFDDHNHDHDHARDVDGNDRSQLEPIYTAPRRQRHHLNTDSSIWTNQLADGVGVGVGFKFYSHRNCFSDFLFMQA